MKYKPYLPNGLKVSEIGLGAWQLGVNSGWKGMSEKEAIAMVHLALDRGVNFIDTAPNYGHGSGELRLGKALRGIDRDSYVINTKFGHTDSGGTNFEADYIRESLEGSLRRLELDYVDSIIIHNPPSEYLDGRKNDHYEILERLKDEGKIRAYGASLDTAAEMKLLMDTTGSRVIEAFFNILHQDVVAAFEQARQQAVAIIAKIPLDSGWLTGKYDADSEFQDIRARWSREDIQTRASLVEKVKTIIGPERNLARTAIAYCLAYDAVSTVIPGNTSLAQLESNLEAAENPLPRELVEALKAFYEHEVEPLNLPW